MPASLVQTFVEAVIFGADVGVLPEVPDDPGSIGMASPCTRDMWSGVPPEKGRKKMV